jgi:hypothetical protein
MPETNIGVLAPPGRDKTRGEFRSKKLRALEQRTQIWQLRLAGLTHKQIGEALTPKISESSVRKALKRFKRDNFDVPIRESAQLEEERLDMMLQAIWTQVMNGKLGAIDRALRIAERRANLLGLDKPKKVAPTDPEGDKPYGNEYSDLSDAERMERIMALVERARERRDAKALGAGGGQGS